MNLQDAVNLQGVKKWFNLHIFYNVLFILNY